VDSVRRRVMVSSGFSQEEGDGAQWIQEEGDGVQWIQEEGDGAQWIQEEGLWCPVDSGGG
jgi:hypothetical protein